MAKVSIVLPTYNRLGQLKRTIAALERQCYAYEKFEVVVVSDGSTDGTDEYLRSLKTPLCLLPVFQANCGPAIARNTGVKHARGELILFIDDDIVADPGLIAEHVRLHQHKGPDVVVLGPMLIPSDSKLLPWVHWEQEMLVKQYDDMLAGRWEPTARQFYTGNASIARQHIIEVGGFNPKFRRAEDVELAYRLARKGLQFVFAPRAVSYHYAERSFRSWLVTPYAYGRNDVIFTRDHCQKWLLPQVFREFHRRNRLVRLLIHVCAGRELPAQIAVLVLKNISFVCNRLGLRYIARISYSGIFNLRYYHGVIDELGDRGVFFKEINSYV